jgi:hypothetical protein
MKPTTPKLVQMLKKEFNGKLLLAEQYYALISTINSLKLTEREIQLIAYVAIRGSLNINVREEFCKMYNTSLPTINNMISRLKPISVLIKEDGKIRINPAILLDFNKDVVLQITLEHKLPS